MPGVFLKGPLSETFELARAEAGCAMQDLTVLSPTSDPYRTDTPAGRRNAQWFKDRVEELYRPGERFHLRGLHYRLVARGNVVMPSGKTYINDFECWEWLGKGPAKAGRWLGYVEFDRVIDNRNDAPEIITREEILTPRPWCRVDAVVPDEDDFELKASVDLFKARQPWQIAIFGEKSSLRDPLLPLCSRYGADLYICNGEISDTLIYEMAKRASSDGRSLALFTLADFDPSGYQMPVSLAWKLNAFRILKFNAVRFRVIPVALNETQAIDLDLPSTPMKPAEKRADRWREAFGREQTEIDALLELHGGRLQGFVRDAIDPYFDATLATRLGQAWALWFTDAQKVLDNETADEAGPWQASAMEARELLQEAVDKLDDIGNTVDLPPIEVPEAELDEPGDENVLASSDWSFAAIARKLKARKAYDEGDAEAA